MTVNLKANEMVLKAGDSLHYAGTDKVLGKLILTNQRLYFRPSETDHPVSQFEILFSQIRELIFFNTMKIIPKGLNIVTKDGRELKFDIKKRDEWGRMINKMY